MFCAHQVAWTMDQSESGDHFGNLTDQSPPCCAPETRGFLTSAQFLMLLSQTSYLSFPIGVVGLSGNVIIMFAYQRIGLNSSINVSYFALALSDLFCVLCNMWMALCFVPAFSRFAYRYFTVHSISSVTGAWTSECFARITAYITALISVERCVSVARPLKVGSLFTRQRTCVLLALIYGVNLALASSGFVITRFVTAWNPRLNKTTVRTMLFSTPLVDRVYDVVLIFQSFPAVLIPLATVTVCSVFLSLSLTRSATWRQSLTGAGGATVAKSGDRTRSLRELQLAKTVVIIAVVFIACSTPNAINVLVASAAPQYRATGAYGNTFRFVNFSTFQLSMINSSVNIFIYLSTGTLFRRTAKSLFGLKEK
ncbi:hypothetical protein EGW08_012962 [Elysia chlorotica]|uniref:G-protein coupled receptors family 1 profile domain-containing protein n=1 Tax=Elysia chlorotica TaxID=188477 RepID=A0A433TCH1_ELYCH|nr:hypothetical protein EGW08_012962 [Elysia chlorotica]